MRRSLLILAGVSLFTAQASAGQSTQSAIANTEPTHAAPTAMEVTPNAVSFVDVPVGDTYTTTVTITNANESVLQIKKITASRDDFQITGIMLPVVVAHGTSQSFTVSYRAQAEGRTAGEISILTNSGDLPLVFPRRDKKS